MMRDIVFVGCGDGAEIEPFTGLKDCRLIGLEPDASCYIIAAERYRSHYNVQVLQTTLQRWCEQENDQSVDEIFFIFPAPQILVSQAATLCKSIRKLLRPTGKVCLFSEATIYSPCPEHMNAILLGIFMGVAKKTGFLLEVYESDFMSLPAVAQASTCGRLYAEGGWQSFTTLTIKNNL